MSKKKKNQSVVSVNNDASVKKHSDWIAKVLSVAAAVALWFYVMDAQTTQYEKTFYGVDVELMDLDSENDLAVISGRDSKVDVTLRGTKATINSISDNDIKATADLSSIKESGKYEFKINVSAPSGATVIDKSVGQVQLYIDKNTTKPVKVEVNKLHDNLPGDCAFLPESVTPGFIQVSGPADIVNRVFRAKATIEMGAITGVHDSVYARSTVVLEDEDGNVIDNPYIKCDKTTVDITVPIEKGRYVEINAATEETDLEFDCDVEPKRVYIVGKPSDVDSYKKISTYPITVNQAGISTVGLVLTDIKAYEDENKEKLINEVKVTISNVVDPKELEEKASEEASGTESADGGSTGAKNG